MHQPSVRPVALSSRFRASRRFSLVVTATIAMTAAAGFAQETNPASTDGISQNQDSSSVSQAPVTETKTTTTNKMHWDQWRGPSRTAKFDSFQLPENLDVSLAWKSEKLGPSYSGPICDGSRIFTTATEDRKTEVVLAYDRATGKQLWKAEWEGSMTVPFFAAANGSWIRSTPACDDQSVYVVGIQDVLVCLNSETGEERWRVDFAAKFETGNPPFGAVCSPLLTDDHLYLQAANRLFKLKKSDGSVVWESMQDQPGMASGGCFSSPILTKLNEKEQLLVQSRTELAAVDPGTGKVNWKVPVPNFRGMNILTPSVWNDSVFTSTYNNQSFLYSPDNGGSAKLDWKSSAKGYMASPVILDDHAYLLLQNGRFACLSLADGSRKWTSDKKVGDYVSCVTDGNLILTLSNEGTLSLIRPNHDFMDLVAEYQLPEVTNSWAHIGIGQFDGKIQLFVRSLDSLRVYDWQ